jgi:hypothetical protein
LFPICAAHWFGVPALHQPPGQSLSEAQGQMLLPGHCEPLLNEHWLQLANAQLEAAHAPLLAMRAAHDGGDVDLQYLPAPEQSPSEVHWHTPPEQLGTLTPQLTQLAPQWLASVLVQAAQVLALQ